jgi:hypothetical protein
MGFSPQQVDRMSVWQFMAALEGFVSAHDPDGEKRLTEGEKDDLWQWLQEKGE